MKIYCDVRVDEALHREYEYVFASFRYPGIPRLDIQIIDKNTSITLAGGGTITTIEAMHYKLPVLGFRYKNFTYITDAKTFLPEEIEKVKGTFDIVFADPPYDFPKTNLLPEFILGKNLVNPNGVLIIEHGRDTIFNSIKPNETRSYGKVNFSFFKVLSNEFHAK